MTTIVFRDYDRERDKENVVRIYHEIGWIDSTGVDHAEGEQIYIDGGKMLVAEMNGQAECFVLTHPGTIKHLNDELPLSVVAGVGTSRVARKQRCASRLTARAIAEDVTERGAIVSALGMFEQGYYNRFGFGSAAYTHNVRFDPAHLIVDADPRPPVRLNDDDFERMHSARIKRYRRHGAITETDVSSTQAQIRWGKVGRFGLGYVDESTGEITHHFWCQPKGEWGPYRIAWMSYQTREQFLELMALIKTLGDQVRSVVMREPPHVQLQDMVDKPFRSMNVTNKGDFKTGITTYCWWQLRICDVPACMARTHLSNTEPLRFNLELTDPISRYLEDGSTGSTSDWKGVGGQYIITAGQKSHAETNARDDRLPTLRASVNAFTRMWFGVRPATGISFTESEFEGPSALLDDLDRVFCLPAPKADWEF